MTTREGSPLAPELVDSAYSRELRYGAFLFEACSLADLAHATMLVERDLVPRDAGSELLIALLELHSIPAAEFPFDPRLGDVYTNRQREVEARAPEAGRWLPLGRPRREATTVAYVIAVRRRLLQLGDALIGFADSLLRQAKTHAGDVMPDYTYLQRATPTTLAHYLLTFVPPIARDLDRLRVAYTHVNRSPAGAGSTNGSRLPLDREMLAESLGFDTVSVHGRDAMWQPDTAIEVMAVITAALANADRLAEDLMVWATSEFGFVTLAQRHTRTSVIMPHKQNPYSLAYVRGVAREAVGRMASVANLQLTPTGQPDNRVFSYSIVPESLDESSRAIELLSAVLDHIQFATHEMKIAAEAGYGGATDLAELLVEKCGIDPVTAHDLVRDVVRRSRESDTSLSFALVQASAKEALGRSLELSEEEIAEVLDPTAIVSTHSGIGGASPEAINDMLTSFADQTSEARRWHSAEQQRVDQAAGALLARAEALCRRT